MLTSKSKREREEGGREWRERNPFWSYSRYKHYERWASAHEFPLQNIINDGSTTFANRYIPPSLVPTSPQPPTQVMRIYILHVCENYVTGIIQFSLGAIADLDLAVRSKSIKEDIMVVSSLRVSMRRYHLLVGASMCIQRVIATHAIVHVYYHSFCALNRCSGCWWYVIQSQLRHLSSLGLLQIEGMSYLLLVLNMYS